MKAFWHIARILTGLVFIFSGFVKGIDPWGSAYKFTDYFNAWGMEALNPLALPLGILQSAAEFAIGLALVTNVFVSFFAAMALLLMLFFTGLTLVIAINNPVADCGCFGDAIKLTNWQTFFKNVILLILAIIVFRFRKRYKPIRQSTIAIILNILTVFVFAYLIDYSFKHLPIIDFRPYKAGINITEAMQFPDDAPGDVYQSTFIYRDKKTGEEKRFTEDNYPWRDSLNWEFVSMNQKLIKKGYAPPIRDFIIETNDGDDITDMVLDYPGYTFVLIVYDTEKANTKNISAVNKLAAYALDNEINFIGLTSGAEQQTGHFKAENHIMFDFFYCDEITLKTIIRSNPGLMLIKNGTIIDKWHYNDFPGIDEFKKQREYLNNRRTKGQ